DRVGQRRPGERARYLLRNGRGAELTAEQSLARAPWIVAAELDDRRRESRIFLAAEIDVADIQRIFAAQIAVDEVVELDDASGAVVARRRERLGELVLRESSFGISRSGHHRDLHSFPTPRRSDPRRPLRSHRP